jgi:two-component system sensor histidine kinase DegS
MSEAANGEELSPLEKFVQHTTTELEQVGTGLREIGLLVEQSQGEVDKLAQRNAQITSKLRQIQAQFETIPREDIKASYEDAQDTQQRLFTMRGQLEKLQSDQTNLKRYQDFLKQTMGMLETGVTANSYISSDGGGETVIEKIISAQDDERRKISRQIHDGPAQALSNFILQTEIALRVFDVDSEKAKEELQNLKNAASNTFANVRDFIFDLRPMMLDDLGLIPTVRRYIEAFREKTGLEISLVVAGSERRLEPHREVLCFRAIQQLLGNVRDHAQATQVKLNLILDDQEFRVTIEDNGVGFIPSEVLVDSETPKGLTALEDRIQQVGGELTLESEPDQGTRVTLSIPARDRI